jgi:hypothetical protein
MLLECSDKKRANRERDSGKVEVNGEAEVNGAKPKILNTAGL